MILVCECCGSEDVRVTVVINPNTNDIDDYRVSDEEYCVDCGDTANLINKEDYIED